MWEAWNLCSHEVPRKTTYVVMQKRYRFCAMWKRGRIHSKLLMEVALPYNVVKDSRFSRQYNDGSTLEFPRLLVLTCNFIENVIPKKRSLCKNCILEWRGKENISREAIDSCWLLGGGNLFSLSWYPWNVSHTLMDGSTSNLWVST